MDADLESQIFDALQRKSTPDIERLASALPAEIATKLLTLSALHGSADVLGEARTVLGNEPVVVAALDELKAALNQVQRSYPDVDVYIDLTELRGFRYHTGLVFAVYLEGRGSAIAKGGRYDNIGAVFGRDRPATGFAIDLKALVDDAKPIEMVDLPVIAPQLDDPTLREAIAALRSAGRVVVIDVPPGVALPDAERLVEREGQWVTERDTAS